MTVIINGTDNAVGNPAIQGSTGGTTAGLYYPAANTVAITTSGVNALTISSTQAATFANAVTTTGALTSGGTLSTASARTYLRPNSEPYALCLQYSGAGGQGGVFIGSTSGGNPDMVFSNNAGTEVMRMRADTGFSVGSTGSAIVRCFVLGATSDNTAYSHFATNSTGTVVFNIRNDGYLTTGGATFSPYNYTTGNAANVYIDTNGGLLRTTSSLKYKHDVKDAYYGLENLLQLRPVTYKAKNDGDKVFGGLIAEEVDAAGLKEFVVYRDDDGTPDSLAYGNMVSLCIKAIQELNAKVDAQAQRITDLEEQVLNLGTQ
jgi:hypothetical protein